MRSRIQTLFQGRSDLAISLVAFCTQFYTDLSSASPDLKESVYNSYINSFISYNQMLDASYVKVIQVFDYTYNVLDEQFAQVKQQEAEALSKIEQSEKQINLGYAQLEEGKSHLNIANQEYLKGLNAYNGAKNEATAELSSAEAKINNSQNDINNLENAGFYVTDRSKNLSNFNYFSDADRIDQISKIFPLIFFIVAALVALTSMTRMVEEERTTVGTYKALGLNKFQISLKFIIYGLIASVIGSVIGLIILPQVIPYVIMYTYQIIYTAPFHLPMPFDVAIAFMSALAGIGITLLATLFAVIYSLKEVPASLMVPAAPKAGKQILIEHVSCIWNIFNFRWKITLRNMFFNKKRFIMTIVGIAGCTALLLTGLGLYSAINGIIENQWGRITLNNFSVSFVDDFSTQDKESFTSMIKTDDYVEDYSYIYSSTFLTKPEKTTDIMVTVMVPEDLDSFCNLRLLQNRSSKEMYSLNDDNIIITEKLASLLEIKEGDTITVYEQDSIGNASSKSYDLKICGITENYFGHYLYMSKNMYEKYFDKAFTTNSFITKYTGGANDKNNFRKQAQNSSSVKIADFTDKDKDVYAQAIKSVNSVVYILIISAAFLAFIVLYNLTNINICERLREIATLKVLGMGSLEVNAYVHRETVTVTFLGAVVGVIFGLFLASFVVESAEIDYCMFARDISFWTICAAMLITWLFAIVVLTFMRKKLYSISMVESLKSNE